MVNKPHSENRWKQGRLSIRIHEDLREALDFVASTQHRPISNLVELVLADFIRAVMKNDYTADGERCDKRSALALKDDYRSMWGRSAPMFRK